MKSRWFCDAKSVCDRLSKDVVSPQDKRVAIELAALKQLLNRGLGDELRWIDNSVMVADPLTKDEAADDEVLFRLMESNEYNVNASEGAKQMKKRKAEQRSDLKKEKKSGVGGRRPAAMKLSGAMT